MPRKTSETLRIQPTQSQDRTGYIPSIRNWKTKEQKAHKKIADVLLNAKALKIEGGTVEKVD